MAQSNEPDSRSMPGSVEWALGSMEKPGEWEMCGSRIKMLARDKDHQWAGYYCEGLNILTMESKKLNTPTVKENDSFRVGNWLLKRNTPLDIAHGEWDSGSAENYRKFEFLFYAHTRWNLLNGAIINTTNISADVIPTQAEIIHDTRIEIPLNDGHVCKDDCEHLKCPSFDQSEEQKEQIENWIHHAEILKSDLNAFTIPEYELYSTKILTIMRTQLDTKISKMKQLLVNSSL